MYENHKCNRRRKTVAALGLCAAMTGFTPAIAGSARWYSNEQVERGTAVFAQHCAECHGADAEATPEWRKPTPEGNYPPPPLNGTAHAWHHSLEVLRRQINLGGVPLGGVMPPFKDKLSDADIDAAIAFFQSKWSEEIYAAWTERDGDGSVRAAAAAAEKNEPTRFLRQRFPTLEIGPAEETPLQGVVRVKAGREYVYLTADGRHAFLGSLLDLETGANLTEERKSKDRLSALAAFPDLNRIVFPAQGTEQARLTVFTDTSCGYCRKLHRDVPRLRGAGVTVSYIPFPRSGPAGDAYETMRKVWCSPDRRTAMDIAKGVTTGELGGGDCKQADAVKAGYGLGVELGVTGAPSIVLPDGRLQPGYLPPERLLSALGRAGQQTTSLSID